MIHTDFYLNKDFLCHRFLYFIYICFIESIFFCYIYIILSTTFFYKLMIFLINGKTFLWNIDCLLHNINFGFCCNSKKNYRYYLANKLWILENWFSENLNWNYRFGDFLNDLIKKSIFGKKSIFNKTILTEHNKQN